MIRISEETRIPGTDIILEKGDRIELVKEAVTYDHIGDFAREIADSVANGVLHSRDLGATVAENLFDELEYQFERFGVTDSVKADFIKGFRDTSRKEM